MLTCCVCQWNPLDQYPISVYHSDTWAAAPPHRLRAAISDGVLIHHPQGLKSYFGFCLLRVHLAPTYLGSLPGHKLWDGGLLGCHVRNNYWKQMRGAGWGRGEAELWCSGNKNSKPVPHHSKAGMALQRQPILSKGSGIFITIWTFVQGQFLRKDSDMSHQQATRLPTGKWVPPSSGKELKDASQHPLHRAKKRIPYTNLILYLHILIITIHVHK